MSTEAIAALNALSATDTTRLTQLQPAPSTFDTLVGQLSGVNEQMQANAQSLQSVALGETDNLHQVMMNLERAKLDFDLLLAVRNKVLDAYQELMRMQI